MHEANTNAHQLTGFPKAASAFVSAFEANQQKLAVEAGLTGTELRALFRVAHVVSITPKALAAHLGLTTGAITAISRHLVEVGLFHRVDHPDDRRSLFLELTPRGHDLMNQLLGDFYDMLAASTTSLSGAELAVFTDSLTAVAAEVTARIGGT